ANFLDSSISVMDMTSNTLKKTINLIEFYDPVTGAITGPIGGLPIQTPVSPDGTNMITANILDNTITVVDTRHLLPNNHVNPNEDEVVASLPCDPGCHGVQYGAKVGGGYYAYVASKFGNALTVVDPDPNGDGNPSDAVIAGRVLLAGSASAVHDDTVIGNKGMGGQGVLPVPNVYNGWVQQWVHHCKTKDCKNWNKQLTSKQKNPGPVQ
ncbi:MAG: YncE family protein, partial [Nitrospiraceae bacterium]